MKKLIPVTVAIVQILTIASCKKETLEKPYYDNSSSYVHWTITAEKVSDFTSPPLFADWSFKNSYSAPRVQATASVAPFFGYPVGSVTPNGKLNFNYSNDGPNNAELQGLSLFFMSDIKLRNGPSDYNLSSSYVDNFIARASMKGSSRNLYMLGDKSNLTVTSYNDQYSIGDKSAGSYAIVKGKFEVMVTDKPGGDSRYLITGEFQLPVQIIN